VSMGWTAVRKLREVVANVRTCPAVEVCCAAQGIDLRAEVAEPSEPLRAVHAAVRAQVPVMLADREGSEQIITVDSLLPELVAVAGARCGALGPRVAVTGCINGRLLPDDEASISVFDHGLVVGDGIFETVKVAGGVPFALIRHLARLSRSAAGLGLPELDLESIRAGADALLEASGRPQRARLRITVTGGMSGLG